MKTKLQKATYWASVSVIGIVIGISLQFVKAWTEPSQQAPNSNVGAPLTTGIMGQTKSGGLMINTGGAPIGFLVPNGNVGIGTVSPTKKLNVNGDISIGTLYNNNDWNYYVNPANISRMNSIVSNSISTSTPLTAPMMIDSNNPNYYIAPSGISKMNAIFFNDGSRITSGGDKIYQYNYGPDGGNRGWTKLPNGLIMQWGTTSIVSNGGVAVVIFPRSFPNAVLNAQVSNKAVAGYNEQDLGRVESISQTGINIRNSAWAPGSWGAQYYWTAIGY